MSWGSYSEAHRGASSGTADPVTHAQSLPGAKHSTAGEIDGARRNAYSLAPGAGQAASAPLYAYGVLSNDKGHDAVLDGHQGSVLASHPDSQFAQQTALDSQHSLNANYETVRGALGFDTYAVFGQSTDLQPLKSGSQATVVSNNGVLISQRATRLSEQPELLVKDARSASVRRFGDLLGGEWQVPQLALLGLGGVMLTSAVF